MINTIIENDNKNKISSENILNDIYFLHKWEIIKTFCISKRKFFFKKETVNADLFRKFSSGNLLEKYLIKSKDEKILSRMDLRVYKDCVYIINLDINAFDNYEKISDYMLQIAIEKALYNTSKREVFFNLNSGLITGNKIRKILLSNEFKCEEEQSDYEKKMFGETFYLKADISPNWIKKIKQTPILINE